MEENDYKVDRYEIATQNENRALEVFQKMTDKLPSNNIKFLKVNYEYKKMRDRKTEPNIGVLLSITWTKISALCGLKTDTGYEIAQDITNMIFSVYADLTLEEIYKAFELERYGVYEEKTSHFQLFNTDYVSDILKKYKKWKLEQRRIHDIKPPEPEKEIPEISDSRKYEIISEGIIRVFKEYKETGEINEPFTHVFDELISRKIIKTATKEEPEIAFYYQRKLQQATDEIVKELKSEKTENILASKNIKIEIEKAISGSSDKVQIRAKRIVLKEFFDKKIKLNTDFEKLIKRSPACCSCKIIN